MPYYNGAIGQKMRPAIKSDSSILYLYYNKNFLICQGKETADGRLSEIIGLDGCGPPKIATSPKIATTIKITTITTVATTTKITTVATTPKVKVVTINTLKNHYKSSYYYYWYHYYNYYLLMLLLLISIFLLLLLLFFSFYLHLLLPASI